MSDVAPVFLPWRAGTISRSDISPPETVYQRLQRAIEAEPALTERELSQRLFGAAGTQARVRFGCELLMIRGLIVRSGRGGRSEPFRYSSTPGACQVSAI